MTTVTRREKEDLATLPPPRPGPTLSGGAARPLVKSSIGHLCWRETFHKKEGNCESPMKYKPWGNSWCPLIIIIDQSVRATLHPKGNRFPISRNGSMQSDTARSARILQRALSSPTPPAFTPKNPSQLASVQGTIKCPAEAGRTIEPKKEHRGRRFGPPVARDHKLAYTSSWESSIYCPARADQPIKR